MTPIKTTLIEGGIVKVSGESAPERPKEYSNFSNHESFLKFKNYDEALDKFKRECVTAELDSNLLTILFPEDSKKWLSGTSITMDSMVEYVLRGREGIYKVEGKGLVYTVEQRMTDGWVPTYNDPDNAGCHPNAELIEVAIVTYKESATKKEQPEDKYKIALDKINAIRNSIVGLQTMNWSEHIYPLVAALNEAGIEGMGYPKAREYFGTMLERTNKAESKIASLEEELRLVREEESRLKNGIHDIISKATRNKSIIKMYELERVLNNK